ncbi:hypothetical protein CGSMWGv6119V5_03046 [Gardnerella vaginalis 6119V5]|nr:hypothetical protein CGSMWGv6119V5_03046 [Gardnerella vaginalis 6119V5]
MKLCTNALQALRMKLCTSASAKSGFVALHQCSADADSC